MTEAGKLRSWIRANIEALLSSEWLGKAGERFEPPWKWLKNSTRPTSV